MTQLSEDEARVPDAVVIAELARVKAVFQLRAIEAVLGLPASPDHRQEPTP